MADYVGDWAGHPTLRVNDSLEIIDWRARHAAEALQSAAALPMILTPAAPQAALRS